MQKIKKFFKNKENLVLFLLSIALTVNSIFLVIQKFERISFSGGPDYASLIAFIYFFLSALVLGTILFFNEKFDFKKTVKKILLVYLPTQAIFLYEINGIKMLYCPILSKACIIFNNLVPLFTVIYFVLIGYLIIKLRNNLHQKSDRFLDWFKKQGKMPIIIVFMVFVLNFGFGIYHLPKMAAVDEALWTYDRIPKYWNNVSDGEWQKTRVSDKPGITVALISGIGLNWVNPAEYEAKNAEKEASTSKNILKMNFDLRLPILLFNALMIFVFYFFLSKLLGKKTAVLGTILIGLSPILLGISTIINPDSLLWVFIPLSILSFLVYRKEDKNAYLYWSGILLGLAILTKYVANILYIFFFLVIFLEYVLSKERCDGSVSAYLKKSLIDYFIIIFFSLLTFLVFLPASWLETSRLFEATIFSQAFQKVWPLFLGLIIFIFLDIYLIKGKLMSNFLNFISKFKKVIIKFFLSIFVFSVLFTAGNVYLKMKWFDFESILASPKSSYLNSEFLGLWGANFYSMIFGIMPLALLASIFLLVKIIKKPEIGNKNLTALYLVIFILLYYFASTINNVSATVRYQIVTYPLALIIAAIGIIQLINNEKIKKYVPEYLAYFSIIIFSIYALNFIKPFYFSYASSLLPRDYVLNLKDMGDGSYEAAQYLNSLPDLKNLKIWTDKNGVCTFFQGLSCSSSVGNVKNGDYFDYFVVSSGRESRTSKMVLARFNGGNDKITRLDRFYQLEGKDLEWKLEIGERPNNFVKIIKAETLLN